MEYIYEKHFTPEVARKTLPLVRKIVKDIIEAGFQIRTISESLGSAASENAEIQKLLEEITYFLEELSEIGCIYKDPTFYDGIIDFPSIIDGKEVFLCWHINETDILFYHNIEDGFAGRIPIPPNSPD